MVKARVMRGKGPQHSAEPIGVLPVEVGVFGQRFDDFVGVFGVGFYHLQAKPFVHDQPVRFPLSLERVDGFVAATGADQVGQRGKLLGHIVSRVILFLRQCAVVIARQQGQRSIGQRPLARLFRVGFKRSVDRVTAIERRQQIGKSLCHRGAGCLGGGIDNVGVGDVARL